MPKLSISPPGLSVPVKTRSCKPEEVPISNSSRAVRYSVLLSITRAVRNSRYDHICCPAGRYRNRAIEAVGGVELHGDAINLAILTLRCGIRPVVSQVKIDQLNVVPGPQCKVQPDIEPLRVRQRTMLRAADLTTFVLSRPLDWADVKRQARGRIGRISVLSLTPGIPQSKQTRRQQCDECQSREYNQENESGSPEPFGLRSHYGRQRRAGKRDASQPCCDLPTPVDHSIKIAWAFATDNGLPERQDPGPAP